MKCVCVGAGAGVASRAPTWRSKACRVINPVLESYCAWMMMVAFFASSSAMRVWCASKSSALGGLNSARTPITRSDGCRTGHARIL